MFDVFSIQFSRYGLAHTRYVLPAFCTPSASRNVLTGSFLTAHRMQSMVLYIETAARCSVCLRQTPASLNDTHKSPRSLHSHGFFIRIVCLSNVHPLFLHASMQKSVCPLDRAVSIKNVWQPPALPCRLQHSTIGRTDLHRRVRDGNGCALRTHRHQTDFSRILSFPPLHENPTEMQPLLHSSLRTAFYPLERR